MKNFFGKRNTGFTLIEILTVTAIIIAIGGMVTKFQKNILSSNTYVKNSLIGESEVRIILRSFISEVRSATPSAVGGYTIESATPSSFIFFSDLNGNGNAERVRYFLEGTKLKKGIIYPAGDPLSYDQPERVVTIFGSMVPGTIFEYYDGNYDGTGSPMASPTEPGSVRVVKINMSVDFDGAGPASAFSVSSMATIRNLKE